ncbi:MAG: hypothetical protein V1734_05035 [Nanoarchaeota archaeon]
MKLPPFTALENSTPDSFRFNNNNRKRIAQALKQARSGKKKDIKNKEVERAEKKKAEKRKVKKKEDGKKRKVKKANGCSATIVYWQSPAGLCTS